MRKEKKMNRENSTGNHTTIRYPRYSKLLELFQDRLKLSRECGEPLCMALDGASGVGKTTLVKDLLRESPQIKQADSTKSKSNGLPLA